MTKKCKVSPAEPQVLASSHGSICRRQFKRKFASVGAAVQKEMETWRRAREVGEREERSYTDTAAGLPIPKVAVEVRAPPA